MATQATSNRDVSITVPHTIVIDVLTANKEIAFDVYTKAVNDAVAAGHDLNDTGVLLMSALQEGRFDKISFLFSIGAQVADATGLFGGSYRHAYGRINVQRIANLMLSHTMSSKYFDVIKTFFSVNKKYLETFNNVSDNAELAAFYIRLGFLPTTRRANAEIQALCGAAGLWYPDVVAANEKAQAQQKEKEKEKEEKEKEEKEKEEKEKEQEKLKDYDRLSAENAELKAKLAVSEDLLVKAEGNLVKSQAIIGRLTSL